MFANTLGAGRGGGPDLPPRLPLLGAPGHAGGAHAAGRRGGAQGAGGRGCARQASARWPVPRSAGSAGSSRCWSSAAARGRTEAFAPFRHRRRGSRGARRAACVAGAQPSGSTAPPDSGTSRSRDERAARGRLVPAPARRPQPVVGRAQDNITAIITRRKLDQATLDELEEALIAPISASRPRPLLVEELGRSRFGKEVSEQEVRRALANSIAAHARAGRAAARPRSRPGGRR